MHHSSLPIELERSSSDTPWLRSFATELLDDRANVLYRRYSALATYRARFGTVGTVPSDVFLLGYAAQLI